MGFGHLSFAHRLLVEITGGSPVLLFSTIAVILGLFVALTVILIILERKISLPKKVLNFFKLIIFFLTITVILDRISASGIKSVYLEKGILFLKFILAWITINFLIEQGYSQIYLSKIRKRQANRIYIDVFKFFILCILVATALRSSLNLDIGSLLTSSVILTAVVGFSMHDTIGSLISGLLIQMEKPFEIGEWISVADVTGKVVETTWRYTKLETLFEYNILIPNNNVPKNNLINYSSLMPYFWTSVTVPIPLDVSPVKAKSTIMQVLKKCPYVQNNPNPSTYFREIDSSHLVYTVWFATQRFEDQYLAQDQVLSTLWYSFRAEDIDLPHIQQDVHLSRKRALPSSQELLFHTLRSIRLFEGLPDEELGRLTTLSTIMEYHPGMIIVADGDTDSKMYIILEGRVAVYKRNRKLAELSTDNFFGEMALLTGRPREADVVTSEKTRCLLIDREGFKVLLEKNPSIIENINEILIQRVKEIQNITSEEEAKHKTKETLFIKFKRIWGISI